MLASTTCVSIGLREKESFRHPHQRRRGREKPQAVPHGEIRCRRHLRHLQIVERCAEEQLDRVFVPFGLYTTTWFGMTVFSPCSHERLLRRKVPLVAETLVAVTRAELPERRIPRRAVARRVRSGWRRSAIPSSPPAENRSPRGVHDERGLARRIGTHVSHPLKRLKLIERFSQFFVRCRHKPSSLRTITSLLCCVKTSILCRVTTSKICCASTSILCFT